MQQRFLTAAGVARLFELSVETVHALVAEGRLPAADSEAGKGASFFIRLPMAAPARGCRGCRMRRIR